MDWLYWDNSGHDFGNPLTNDMTVITTHRQWAAACNAFTNQSDCRSPSGKHWVDGSDQRAMLFAVSETGCRQISDDLNALRQSPIHREGNCTRMPAGHNNGGYVAAASGTDWLWLQSYRMVNGASLCEWTVNNTCAPTGVMLMSHTGTSGDTIKGVFIPNFINGDTSVWEGTRLGGPREGNNNSAIRRAM